MSRHRTRHKNPPASRRQPERRRTRPAAVAAVIALTISLLAAVPAGAALDQPLTEDTSSVHASAFGGTANSANARFVVATYPKLLGRDADVAGVDFHLSRLISGGDRSRQTFTYSLLFSTEGSRQEVIRAYDDLLDRAADATGESYWTDHLQGHGVLDLRVLLMASDEYYDRAGGTNTAWIEALYQDVLGRASDPSGLTYWLGLADAGVARPLIVAGLYLSEEALGRRVAAYYTEALSRSPLADEQADGIAYIRAHGERQLRSKIWASDEIFEQYLDAALS